VKFPIFKSEGMESLAAQEYQVLLLSILDNVLRTRPTPYTCISMVLEDVKDALLPIALLYVLT